jgi:hypothetical protein
MLKKLLSWSALQIALVLFNIVVVAAGVVLPRLLSRPEFSLVSAEIVSDEEEVTVPKSLGIIIEDAFFLRSAGDSISVGDSSQNCLGQLTDQYIVTASCRSSVLDAVNQLIVELGNERDRKLAAIEKATAGDSEELSLLLESEKAPSGMSKIYYEVFLNYIAVQNFAKDEIKQDVQQSLLATARNVIAREYFGIQYLNDLKALLENSPAKAVSSGSILIRTVVMNAGYSDGVVIPEPTLLLAGTEVNLRIVAVVGDSILPTSSQYVVVPAGTTKELILRVDHERNSDKVNELVAGVIEQKSPISASLTVMTSEGSISRDTTFPITTISFESDRELARALRN